MCFWNLHPKIIKNQYDWQKTRNTFIDLFTKPAKPLNLLQSHL